MTTEERGEARENKPDSDGATGALGIQREMERQSQGESDDESGQQPETPALLTHRKDAPMSETEGTDREYWVQRRQCPDCKQAHDTIVEARECDHGASEARRLAGQVDRYGFATDDYGNHN